MASRGSQSRRKPPPEPEATHLCEWPGCGAPAPHRAPKSRQELHESRWFCLDHIREFNAAWNYFEGMSDAEVEADIRRDTTWQRPSWRLGTFLGRSKARFKPEDVLRDPFGLFGEGPRPRSSEPPPAPHPTGPMAEAMRVMELAEPLTLEALKKRYKVLVKLHHPDANQGDKAAEERFKRITQAYRTLMTGLSPRAV